LKRKRQTAKEEEEKELYTLDVCLSSWEFDKAMKRSLNPYILQMASQNDNKVEQYVSWIEPAGNNSILVLQKCFEFVLILSYINRPLASKKDITRVAKKPRGPYVS
jgi:hypothetical protein